MLPLLRQPRGRAVVLHALQRRQHVPNFLLTRSSRPSQLLRSLVVLLLRSSHLRLDFTERGALAGVQRAGQLLYEGCAVRLSTWDVFASVRHFIQRVQKELL